MVSPFIDLPIEAQWSAEKIMRKDLGISSEGFFEAKSRKEARVKLLIDAAAKGM